MADDAKHYRFHVLGIPHTASNKEYSQCAFTQKVVNMCRMLKMQGHTVFHYGNEKSQVECDEHVTVTKAGEIGPPDKSGVFDQNGSLYRIAKFITIGEIERRKQPNDFILTFWTCQKEITDHHPDLITVEAGIGYPSGHFAQFKVFESYAVLHAYRGMTSVAQANGNGWWNDAVIPNYYDPDDFQFSDKPGDYLLFMGLRANGGEGKGDYIAAQIAREAGIKLIMAGSGPYHGDAAGCEVLGFVNGKRRAELYAGAKAVLCPSLFVEPFCGVHVEAMMSGTPVISTDWGAFAEYNIHGVTGYRCHNLEQFVWAAKNIDKISRNVCREYAVANFSLPRVARMYDEYWHQVMAIRTGKGWYQPNPDRTDLDWLTKQLPAQAFAKAA